MLDTTVYKNRLEEQLERVKKDLSQIGVYNEVTDDWEAVPDSEESVQNSDINDEADVVEDWNERRATLSDLEREYSDLKRALGKIENGTFGICEISGAPIEEKRLEARPEARTCIAHMNEEGQLPL
jgi:DnaK suppressor protein